MSKLRVAVIGVGYLGRFHAQKYAQLPQCELVGIVDSDQARLDEVAQELQVPGFSDHRALLGKVDAVSVVVPTVYHHAVASDFLTDGVHVLLEKPFTATLEEAYDLKEKSEAHQACLQVGHLERVNPVFSRFAKEIQHPQFIEAHRIAPFPKRGTDVDVILDLMIHDIDLILSLVKELPEAVHSVGVPIVTKSVDLANVRLQFPGGCIATLTASRTSDKAERKLRVFQPGLYLSMDLGNTQARRLKVDSSQQDPETLKPESISFEKGDALLQEIEMFLESIETNSPPIVSAQDGIAAMEVAYQIKQQLQ